MRFAIPIKSVDLETDQRVLNLQDVEMPGVDESFDEPVAPVPAEEPPNVRIRCIPTFLTAQMVNECTLQLLACC